MGISLVKRTLSCAKRRLKLATSSMEQEDKCGRERQEYTILHYSHEYNTLLLMSEGASFLLYMIQQQQQEEDVKNSLTCLHERQHQPTNHNLLLLRPPPICEIVSFHNNHLSKAQ